MGFVVFAVVLLVWVAVMSCGVFFDGFTRVSCVSVRFMCTA